MRQDEKRALQIMGAAAVFAVLIALAAMMAGCSVVMPKDAAYFDLSADNAAAFNGVVQRDGNVPRYVQRWLDDEAVCRMNESRWAHGKAALTTRPAN